MQVTDKRSILRELRQFCYDFKEEYSKVNSVIDQYFLLSDIQEQAKSRFVRQGRRKKVYTSEVVYEISKIFGVSTQTVYRARAAVKASRNGQPPKKYAIRSFNNIQNKIKTW